MDPGPFDVSPGEWYLFTWASSSGEPGGGGGGGGWRRPTPTRPSVTRDNGHNGVDQKTEGSHSISNKGYAPVDNL